MALVGFFTLLIKQENFRHCNSYSFAAFDKVIGDYIAHDNSERAHQMLGFLAPGAKEPALANGRQKSVHRPNWRRGRDSNPRHLAVRRFSRPLFSTTQPPLREVIVRPWLFVGGGLMRIDGEN